MSALYDAARAIVQCRHDRPTKLVVVRESSGGGSYEDELLTCPACGAVHFGEWLQPELILRLRVELDAD